jgi:outer membrane lipoprotein-sorting protein
MRIILLISFLLTYSLLAFTQDFVPIANELAFKKLYIEKSASIQTLKSNFIQEKSISMLEKKLVSEGCFQFKKNGLLRMEYFKPYTYLFLMNKDKITIRNNQNQTTVSTSSNKLFKLISQIMLDCISGEVLSVKEFQTKVFENKTLYLLKLLPKDKNLKSLIKELDVYVSKSDYTVEKIDMFEVSGDFTKMIFKNKQINLLINDEIFTAN